MNRLLPLLLVILSAQGSCAKKEGTVAGTVALFDSESGEFIETVPKATVELRSKEKRIIRLTTDEVGDFHGSLPPGEYALENVLESSGRSLPIFRDQARELVIKAKRHTRFDVMIEKRKETALFLKAPSLKDLGETMLKEPRHDHICAICQGQFPCWDEDCSLPHQIVCDDCLEDRTLEPALNNTWVC